MAEIVKRGTASPVSGNIVILGPPTKVTLAPPTTAYLPPLIAGEPIQAGDACHISGVDGQVYRSFGGGATAYAVGPVGAEPTGYTDASLAQVDGYCDEQVFGAGEAITLTKDIVYDYCNVAQTAGKKLFVSNTVPGGLADAASTNGTAWVGKVMGEAPVATTSTKVLLTISRY